MYGIKEFFPYRLRVAKMKQDDKNHNRECVVCLHILYMYPLYPSTTLRMGIMRHAMSAGP